jgi:hypothetical protein
MEGYGNVASTKRRKKERGREREIINCSWQRVEESLCSSRSWQASSCSRNFYSFSIKVSLPWSQELVSGRCLESDESRSHQRNLFIYLWAVHKLTFQPSTCTFLTVDTYSAGFETHLFAQY